MVNFWEVVNRSATGPRMGEREWDFQIYYKTQDLVKEYDIKWDGESFISHDNTLTDAIFEAALRLFTAKLAS